MEKIGFGGSCHWCTEAIFLSLKGIVRVDQGWISAEAPADSFSEAVVVHYDPAIIPLEVLVEIHLYTHSCTSEHSLREKYRSAIYFYTDQQATQSQRTIKNLQETYQNQIITRVLPFANFRLNRDVYQNYYFKDPDKPFCKNIVDPKLKQLLSAFSGAIDPNKMKHLNAT